MKQCIICDKEFEPKNTKAIFCSEACKQKNKRTKALPDEVRREKESRALLERMNKQLAEKGLPLLIMSQDLPPITYVTSGIPEIDTITHGFPRKRITEIFGLKGVGKTTLMNRVISSVPDVKVFYVDAENALSDRIPTNIHVLNDYVIESVQDNVEQALGKDYDLIVVDSVAALVPRAELEGEGRQMGVKALLMNQWMRRVNYYLHKSNAALVFINQQREGLDIYTPKYTPGGKALPYAASLRLELKSNKTDKKEKYQLVTAIVEKSRFDRPYRSVEFKLFYE